MKYTFTIDDSSQKAHSIINMLRELKDDYDFIQFSDEILFDESNQEIKEELLFRQQQTFKKKQGKNWEQLQNEL